MGSEDARVASSEKKEKRVILSILLMYTVFATKSLSSLVVLPITQRSLDSVEFSIWVLLSSLGSYLFMVEMGLTQIVMNLTGKAYSTGNRQDISAVTVNALAVFVGLSSLVILACVAGIELFHIERFLVNDYEAVRDILPLCLLIFVPLTLLRFPFRVFTAVLNGLRAQHIRLTIDLAGSVVFVAAVAVTVILTKNLVSLVLFSVLSALAVFFVFYPVTVLKFPFIRLRPSLLSREILKRLFKSMLHYAPLPFCLMGQRFLPTFFVSGMDSLAMVPVLYLIIMIYRITLFMVSDSISKGFQPYMIHYHATGETKPMMVLWGMGTKTSAVLSVVLIVVSFAWYAPFARLLLGPETLLLPAVIAVYAVICLVDSVLSTGINNFIAMSRFKSLSALWLAEITVAIVLGLLGGMQTYVSPILGISLGFLAAKLLVSLPGHLILFSRYMNRRGGAFLGPALGWRIILPLAVFGLSLVFIDDILSLPTMATRAAFSILAAVLLALLFWLFTYSGSERAWMSEKVLRVVRSARRAVTIEKEA